MDLCFGKRNGGEPDFAHRLTTISLSEEKLQRALFVLVSLAVGGLFGDASSTCCRKHSVMLSRPA
jgi:hypothetical protein